MSLKIFIFLALLALGCLLHQSHGATAVLSGQQQLQNRVSSHERDHSLADKQDQEDNEEDKEEDGSELLAQPDHETVVEGNMEEEAPGMDNSVESRARRRFYRRRSGRRHRRRRGGRRHRRNRRGRRYRVVRRRRYRG